MGPILVSPMVVFSSGIKTTVFGLISQSPHLKGNLTLFLVFLLSRIAYTSFGGSVCGEAMSIEISIWVCTFIFLFLSKDCKGLFGLDFTHFYVSCVVQLFSTL